MKHTNLHVLSIPSSQTSTTLTPEQTLVLLNTTSTTNYTITLPAPNTCKEKLFIIRKLGAGTGTLTVAAPSGSLIDDAASKTFTNGLVIVSDGSKFYTVAVS